MKANKFTMTIMVGAASIWSVGQVWAANADLIDGDYDQSGPGWTVAASATSISGDSNGIMYVAAGQQQLEHFAIVPRRTDAEDSLK